MSVRMDREEAWRFVASAHTGIIVTLRRDGVPIALPMWFAVFGREIYVRTLTGSKKVARLDSLGGRLSQTVCRALACFGRSA